MNKTKEANMKAEAKRIVEEKEYYAELRSFNPFRTCFAYLDSVDNNAAVLFRNAGIKGKIDSGFVDNETGKLQIGIVSIPKSQRSAFIDCMKQLKKNSILLGWGGTKDVDRVLGDIYKAAGYNNL